MDERGCGEQFYGAFGANYPDGLCVDGYLWDLDSCDEPGGGLAVGGDIPCPKCNPAEYAAYYAPYELDDEPAAGQGEAK